MHGLTVGRDDRHAVALNGHLSRAHRGECVDQTETVAATGRNGEDLERCVGHESSVGIAELTATIDEHRFGILTGVDSQTAGISFGRILVQPITD